MGGDDAVYLFWVCFRGGAMRRSGSVAAPVQRWTMLSSRSNHWFGTRAPLVPDAPNVTKMLLLSNCSALFLNARQSQVLRLRLPARYCVARARTGAVPRVLALSRALFAVLAIQIV